MQETDQQWTQCDICRGKLTASDLLYLRESAGDGTGKSATDGIRTVSTPELICGVCRQGARLRSGKRTGPTVAVPLRGVAAFMFCALAGTTIVTAAAMFLVDPPDNFGKPPREIIVAAQPEDVSVEADLPQKAVEPPTKAPTDHSPSPSTRVPPVTTVATPPRAKPAAAGPQIAVLRVSDGRPRKGRGLRITLTLPKGAVPKSPPQLLLRDARGAAYRSVMRPSETQGEWVWASGLDVTGRWRGAASAHCGSRILTAKLPPITVIP